MRCENITGRWSIERANFRRWKWPLAHTMWVILHLYVCCQFKLTARFYNRQPILSDVKQQSSRKTLIPFPHSPTLAHYTSCCCCCLTGNYRNDAFSLLLAVVVLPDHHHWCNNSCLCCVDDDEAEKQHWLNLSSLGLHHPYQAGHLLVCKQTTWLEQAKVKTELAKLAMRQE